MVNTSDINVLNEAALIREIHAKCRQTFTYVYERHFQELAMTAYRYVKDTGIAQELVQEVFIKIWEQPALLDENGSLRAYLYKAVINCALNYLKREKNIARHHSLIAHSLTDSYLHNLQEEQELKLLIYQQIEKLPPQCRKIFKMSRFDGLKYREIAAQLQVSEKTVENHIAHALKTLRESLFLHQDYNHRDYTTNLKLLQLFLLIAGGLSNKL
ncbi:RNA polymerase sigma-70 factor [Chitinophaga nivalis]|uniref:RNA polymerase sigma-70 factor n=1 Tax=Chitinophaga nivalis TaxID=2991709 RepID=A0ABT3IEM6_9BACT|nr:RNA polymerase sigma-70 factor [Chitinophaga nivalis]MCW3467898.1 RNA polymerase sigma-70 factor [Chitinophaga nivalis]MCW3482411.1 RNA polymerase sigma-70 factor [Chitinophaga nivalis]